MSMLRRQPLARVLILAALAATVWSAPAFAQELTAEAFKERIEVRVINLEVVVTDRDGQRVSGLEAGDFRLLVDGEETAIEYFNEIRDAAVIESVQGIPSVPGLESADSVGTSFLIFVDEFFALEPDKNRVLKALGERVGDMRAGDRVAIVSWDGRNLELLTDWTSSPDEARAAVEAAIERPGLGLHREAERRSWLDTPARRRAATTPRAGYSARYSDYRYRLGGQEEMYALRLADQLEGVVGAAAAAMRGLETPPGRKLMLLLSGGWPWNPAQWVAGSYARMVNEPRIPRGAELYGSLSDTANLLGYTIYGVDMPGLQTTGFTGATRTGTTVRTGDQFLLEQEMHDSLYFLSEETGGLAMINGRRVSAFDEVGGDARSYYWIGFTPDWVQDEQHHEITVEVKGEDLTARSRHGFPDLSPQQQAAMAVRSSLLFGAEGGAEALRVDIGEPEKGKRGRLQLPITISVAASELEAVERDGKYVFELDLLLAAMDSGGGRAETPPLPLAFSGDEPPGAEEWVSYSTTLEVRKKTTELAVTVYDRNSGTMLSRVLAKDAG